MRSTWGMLLLAVTCCFAFSHETKAQITYAYSDMVYYEPTNSILVWAENRADYNTRGYYEVSVEIDIYRDGEYIMLIGGGDNGLGESSTYTYLPYDPNVEYTIEARHYIQMRFMRGEIYAEGYADYYNYIEYMYGNPVYYPLYYDFVGNGPDTTTPFNSILLGLTTAVFTQGARSGPPHHLKVITDRTIVRTDICGQEEKRIDFQLVDINNRGAGRVSVSEEPQSNLVDSCSGLSVFLNPCSSIGVNHNGTFTDNIRTGCPLSGGTPTDTTCGYAWGNRWRWCDPKIPNFTINLAWMYYDVRRAYIRVDNQLDMTDGAYKYP